MAIGGKTTLEIALGNVSAAFREGQKAGVSGDKEGNYRDETFRTYEKTVKTMLRELAGDIGEDSRRLLPKHFNGKTWDRYFDKVADRVGTGSLSADAALTRVHALESLRDMIKETNVLGRDTTIRVGNKEERLRHLDERGVSKSQKDVTAMKPSEVDAKSVQSHINTRTANGRVSLDVNKFQTESGGRIKATLNLQVKDVDFKKNTITFRNDKNNFTRTVPMSPGARDILQRQTEGKSPGSHVFDLKRSDGNRMTLKESVKTVQRYTNDAAKASGVNKDGKRYTTHSNRKLYAQRLYNKSRYMSTKDLKKAIGEYVKMQGSNRNILVGRLKTELNRINAYRVSKGNPKRDFSHDQLRRLYVSLHLGHSRIDVVTRYINPDANSIRK